MILSMLKEFKYRCCYYYSYFYFYSFYYFCLLLRQSVNCQLASHGFLYNPYFCMSFLGTSSISPEEILYLTNIFLHFLSQNFVYFPQFTLIKCLPLPYISPLQADVYFSMERHSLKSSLLDTIGSSVASR